MKSKKETDLTLIYKGQKWEAELIKGLLESNDIKCLIQENIISIISPYTDYDIKVLVLNEDSEKAKKLIDNKKPDLESKNQK